MNKKIFIPIAIVSLITTYIVYDKTRPFKAYGEIEFDKINVPAKINSSIEKKFLQDGSLIKKGDTIYTLACEDIKLIFDKANKDFNRANNLKKANAISDDNYEIQKQKFDDANLKLSWCTIKSPINGKLLINLKEEGEYIKASETIAEVADLSTVFVDFFVNAKDLSKYKLNQNVDVKVLENKYQGRIERINEEAEFTPKNVQTKSEKDNLVYGIRVRIENKNEELKPGMQAEIL